MAYEQYGPFIAEKAGADLTNSQYLAVKFDTNGNIIVAGAGEKAIGILVNDPALGQVGTIQVSGVAKWVAGGAFNKGDYLTPDANGKAVAATEATANTTTGEITGSQVLGIALADASAAGQVVPVLLVHAALV